MSMPQTKVINMSLTLTNEVELMERLEALSRKGWHPVGYKKPKPLKLWQPYGFIFEKGEPEARVYRADFRRGPKADIEEYISLCKDAGWKNIYSQGGFFIFYAPADQAARADFFSDTSSKIAKLRRQRRYILILNAIFIPIMFYIMLLLQGVFSSPDVNPYPAMFTAFILYTFYTFIGFSLRIKALQTPRPETHQGKVRKTGAKRLTAELNSIAVLTLILAPISAHFQLSDWHWSWEWQFYQGLAMLIWYGYFRISIAWRAKSQNLH